MTTRDRLLLIGILAAFLLAAWIEDGGRPETTCFEDEVAVRVVEIWDGETNTMQTVEIGAALYCVAVDDMRTEEE